MIKTTSPRLKSKRAFTLIEVLVVIVIISIAATAIVVSVRRAGPEAQLPIETARFIEVVRFAQDEAIYKNQELGLIIAENGYQFAYYDFNSRRWTPIEEDPTFGVHNLPDGMVLSLQVEGEPLDFPEPLEDPNQEIGFFGDEKQEEEKEPIKPQIWLYSSGDLLPAFNLQFIVETEKERFTYTIVGEFDGYLSKKDPEIR